jgi:uncharacterized protein involved in exopolysaccharide biosynthesis
VNRGELEAANGQHNDSGRAAVETSNNVPVVRSYPEAAESYDAISLPGLARAVWKRAWVVVLAAVTLVGAAVGLSLTETPTYEASIKLLVGQDGGIPETPADVDGLQQLSQTMTEAVDDQPVTEEVIRRRSNGIST